MVSAIFIFDDQSKIVEVNIKGHADFSSLGSDIVCAAISGQVTMFELGLLSYLPNSYKINKKKGCFEVKNLDHQAKMLVQGFYLGLKAIEQKYKNNLKVTTIK